MISSALEKKLTHLRRELHRDYAELSNQEYRTSEKIREYLKEYTNAKIISVGKTGVLAVFVGDQPGKTIMLRADTDALPIAETNTFEHRSVNPKVSHKCGHDGHTTIMLGVAEMLTQQPLNRGTVVLLWQPAEENGTGAQAVISDANFRKFTIDQVFALHNLPGFSKGKILYKNGAFTANVRSLILNFQGKTSHAAEPEHGYNPALAISKTLKFCNKLTEPNPGDKDFFLITPVYGEFGTKDYGISAGSGELHLTIRSWSPQWFGDRVEKLMNKVDELAKKYQLKYDTSWTQEFFSNQNDGSAVDIIRKSAQDLNLDHGELEMPFKWGEDFGLFTQKIPGAMFGIGSGEDCPALHNPDYDFPDDIIPPASQMFYKILEHAI